MVTILQKLVVQHYIYFPNAFEKPKPRENIKEHHKGKGGRIKKFHRGRILRSLEISYSLMILPFRC